MKEELSVSPLHPDEIPSVETSDPAVMCKQPLVTVKMLTYNHEPYIAQAIEGVLMQETGFPIELVIGEDCSTDRTREIVLGYQKRHPGAIRVLTSERNVGASRNSVRTALACRGAYIALCEGDDYWIHPRKLQMQVGIMEADPKVGLVHGRADRFDVVSGRHFPWTPKPADYDDGDLFHRYLTGEYYIFTATACFSSDLYRTVLESSPDLFDGRYLMGDTPLFLELARITKFRLINEPLATYRMIPESATRSRDIQKEIRFWKSDLEMYMRFVERYDVDRATENLIRCRFARRFLRYASAAGDSELAQNAWADLRAGGVRIALSDFVHYCGANHASIYAAVRALRRARKALLRLRT